MQRQIRVLIVDDHAVVRAGYRVLLGSAKEIEIIAEADSGEAGFRAYTEHKPDIVIMDLSLPGISGLEAIRRIVARDSGAKILAFTMHEDTVFVEQALQAGARGYVTKSSAPAVLVEAVKQIAAGSIYLEPDIAQRLALQKLRGPRSSFARLSTREFEIFSLLAEGLNADEIATRVSLSSKTIANYSTQIKNKLEVNSVAEIVRLAIRHGIVKV
ncbi:MAG: response regulator transcription factor [Proteobacteria bacterium]|nr:MAG: response regulator transcription factor [Pseudomonadota bacterium]TDJ65634.1 MAG: response regulator transcription factor [Pseudomonadota bacterium]